MPAVAGFELLPHTAEVQVRARAPTLASLLAEAGRALARVELGVPPGPAAGDWRAVEVRSGDRAALLVDWLNELIWIAETERWVPVEFELETEGEVAVRGRMRGLSVACAPSLVKAATYHALRVEPTAEGFEAEFVLDV